MESENPGTGSKSTISEEEARRRLIAEITYFATERRGFCPGYELDDWLQAEQEVEASLGLAQLLADRGIRVNCVAPGPVWTPLIPSTMPPEKVKNFGDNVPLERPAQPAEFAPAYVPLASGEVSYIRGAMLPVTGGRPML